MNKLIPVLLTSLIAVPVQAQQVNEFDVCTRYREIYTPGRYDSYGNYVRGSVRTEKLRVPCGGETSYYQGHVHRHEQPIRTKPACDPTEATLGALLGGGVGAALSRGDGRYWAIPVGAAVGGGLFGCT